MSERNRSVKSRAVHLKITAVIQTTGAAFGIVSAVVFTGGHPSLAVLIGIALISINLLLALMQVVARMFFFASCSTGEMSGHGTY